LHSEVKRADLVVTGFCHHVVVELRIDKPESLQRRHALDVRGIERTEGIGCFFDFVSGQALFYIFNGL
jgi:hypothetical protein